MPLAILVVAGGLGWWSTHATERRQREVHDLVAAICDDVVGVFTTVVDVNSL